MKEKEENNVLKLIPPTMPDAKVAARELFSMYKAYVDAGFSQQQSMQLLCTLLSSSLSQNIPKK